MRWLSLLIALVRGCLNPTPDTGDTGDTADTGVACTPSSGAVEVTADSPAGWAETRNEAGSGGLCSTYAYSGCGSLCLSIDTPGETSPAYAWSISGDLGALSDLDGLSLAFLRDSATTAYGHFAPAVILYIEESDGHQSSLIWEATYNGYASYSDSIPEDTWVYESIIDDNFWQYDGAVVEVFDRDVTEWGYSADARVVAIGLQLGSGWNGSYVGAVDLLTISFAGVATTWDFE